MSPHVDMIITELLRLSGDGTRQFDFPYDPIMARVTADLPYIGPAMTANELMDLINQDPRVGGKIEVGAISVTTVAHRYLVSARVLGLDAETPSDMVAS